MSSNPHPFVPVVKWKFYGCISPHTHLSHLRSNFPTCPNYKVENFIGCISPTLNYPNLVVIPLLSN